MKLSYILPLLATTSAFAFDYIFVDEPLYSATGDMRFCAMKHPFHLEGLARVTGSQDMRHEPGNIKYRDAHGYAYWSHFFNSKNAISIHAGYHHYNFDWNENPAFSEEDYNYVSTSVGLISHYFDCWRWVVNGGVTISADDFDLSKTGVWHGLLWGRYTFRPNIGLHVGTFFWKGVKNSYTLPILGFDWNFLTCWQLNVIFPLDGSLSFYFTPNWALQAAYRTFGGPYRFPHRARGARSHEYNDAIFSYYASGGELDLKYRCSPYFKAAIGVGYTAGGWLQVKDRSDNHGTYYKFKGGPYISANVDFTF